MVIRPYKRAHVNRGTDAELLHLSRYLCLVGARDTLADLDHKRWERYLQKHHPEYGGGGARREREREGGEGE